MKKKAGKIILIMSAILILLLLSACKKTETPVYLPPFDPEQTPALPPEIVVEVQTNFDILTPLESVPLLHTRLHDGAMSELTPSDNYGMLLPYSSAAILDDGSLKTAKCGFVTIDGVVVTDLIYDSIDRAEFVHGRYISAANERFPAYSLTVNEQDYDRVSGYYYINRKMAACALDGSWITSFDYSYIVFTKEVIILYRDEMIFDIDVIDYEGKHLYNMLDFSWTNSTPNDIWTEMNMYIISDRYAHVRMRNDTFAFIDLLTGQTRPTRFIAADPFVEGYAPVGIGVRYTYYVIWGLINTDLNVVVQPRYYNLPYFVHGRAIVERRDKSQYVINTKGENLFDVPNGYWLEHSYEGPTFIMISESGADPYPMFLSSEFEVIKPSEGSQFSFFSSLRYLGNGWYTTGNNVGSLLINNDEEFYIPDIESIVYFDGEHLVYMKRHDDGNGYTYIYGVMTLDGNDIILPEHGAAIKPVTQNDTLKAFIVSTGSSGYFLQQEYMPGKHRLVDTTGNTIIQGPGVLTYHDFLELYSIQGENHFLWLDINANPIISIPFLSYMFD